MGSNRSNAFWGKIVQTQSSRKGTTSNFADLPPAEESHGCGRPGESSTSGQMFANCTSPTLPFKFCHF